MAIGHFLLCNYLEVLVKPRFEEPVNSVQVQVYCNHTKYIQYIIFKDVHERGLIPYIPIGHPIYKQVMKDLPDPYPELSDRTIEVSYEELRSIAEEDRGKEKDSTFPYLVAVALSSSSFSNLFYEYNVLNMIIYLHMTGHSC